MRNLDLFATHLGACATIATFEEILLAPKPGLVDPENCGSHRDMNWLTFLASACALAPFWGLQARAGCAYAHYKPCGDLMAKLRARGVEMERAMFLATDGVNTHKGLIFAMSLLLGAGGRLFAHAEALTAEAICASAAEIATPAVHADLENIRARAARGERLTHGERIFCDHGIGGIRAEAAAGFPSITRGLRAMEEAVSTGVCRRNAALRALLSIMACCSDTNVIHRAGLDFWRGEYRERIAEATAQFDASACLDPAPLKKLNETLVRRGVSPGGAADLLACTLFLYRSKMSGNTDLSHSCQLEVAGQ